MNKTDKPINIIIWNSEVLPKRTAVDTLCVSLTGSFSASYGL